MQNGDLATFKPITGFGDEYFRKGVEESSRHAWYEGSAPLHPWDGETNPKYTDFNADGKYSWVKSPTFYGKPAQVGPLANVLAMVAAGHEPTKKYVNLALDTVGKLAGTQVGVGALHSTIGRHAARAVRCAVMNDLLARHWQMLIDNIGKGDFTTFNKPTFNGTQMGFGFHEAPRGVLSHWIVIDDGKVKNYQAVVPSTWNACPRNDKDAPGPYESSLVGNPVADPGRPLEVLRTIHSFDPCLACAIHVADPKAGKTVQVKVL